MSVASFRYCCPWHWWPFCLVSMKKAPTLGIGLVALWNDSFVSCGDVFGWREVADGLHGVMGRDV